MEENVPTVFPASPFDPREDAQVLHKAMKGFGTDEKSLIRILCHRTCDQRVQIYHAYKASYGKDLDSALKSELSGCFERVMVSLCLPPAEFMAHQVHRAISGLGTNEETLIEILCSSTNQEICEMNAAYERSYGQSMENGVKGDTSGSFKLLLVALMQGQREESQDFDAEEARADAQRLYEAGAGKIIGTDESVFISTFATRSWSHLRHVIHSYHEMHGHTLEHAVKHEFSFNAEKGLLAILECAKNRHEYFAHRLHHAVEGLETDDDSLIRIIVSRCDVDLHNIKKEYERKFNQSLYADVSGDTSGHYKKALEALIG